jgi:hypothetical protein
MSPTTRLLPAALLLALLGFAVPARASSVELGLGGDYLVDPKAGDFQLTLAGDTALAKHVTLGGRIGLMVVTDPGQLGIPIDARLRLVFGRIYVDGLVGPWIVFDSGDSVRFHGALGFGVNFRSFAVGAEAGVLGSSAMVGLRVSMPL